MCGVCFVAAPVGQVVQDLTIEKMVHAIQHRGPDAQNYLIRDHIALGHTRLSIVDIHSGSQPMSSQDGRFSISFNGEIYNYQQLKQKLESDGSIFNTHSDTEVILQLFQKYGKDCVSQLRGMFAFVIHDQLNNSLFIARDRLGIKPLFYYKDDKYFIGASEMKSIFASGLVDVKFNQESIRNYFRFQFNVPPYTPFENIVELLPGHSLSWDAGNGLHIEKYWDIEFPTDNEYDAIDEEVWMKKLESALHDAADSHMIGEVPIGAYLSGGIDSSTTTYLLKQHYPEDVQTFTMRFTNPAADESAISRTTAAHLEVPNEELTIDDSPAGGYLQRLVDALYHVEQPQRMALDVPLHMLSEMVHQKQYKVVYTGDGADEIMGGYDCFRQDYMRIWGNEQKNNRQRRRYYLNEYTQHFPEDHVRLLLKLHQPKRQKRTIKEFGCYPAWNDYWHFLDDTVENLFNTDFASDVEGDTQLKQCVAQMQANIKGRHPLNQSLYMEIKTRLPNWILWKTDRLTMANSVEARIPFLDHPLVELLAAMPPLLKLNYMDEKYILRKLMLPHMPQHPQQFKKRAFYTPIREWFFNKRDIDRLDSFLNESAIERAGVFEFNKVATLKRQLLDLEQANTANQYFRVMQLEWTLMCVLTIQILHYLFIQKEAPCFK